MMQQPSTPAPKKYIGKATSRIDGTERVTGKATYAGDVKLPGMLHARILRSPHPHARITRIDTTKAAALPGVKAVLTHENCQQTWSSGAAPGGNIYGGQPGTRRLFNNPVRFWGEAIAAVAAVDPYTADDALQLIEVEYERLPFVLDPEDALKSDAPEIYPGGNLAPNARNQKQPETYRRGDVAAGFQGSAHVFEGKYTSSYINNAQLERRASVATWKDGALTLYASTQGISNCQAHMALDLGIPVDKVRVICHFMGGGFGNKNQNHDFDLLAAVLAKETGVPVKVEFTRKEDFTAVHGRWPTRQYYKVGVSAERHVAGRAVARRQRHGPVSEGHGRHLRRRALSVSERRDDDQSGVHQHGRVGQHARSCLSTGGLRHRVDDGRRGVQDERGPGRVPPQEHDAEVQRRDALHRYSLETCVRRGAEQFDWKNKWRKPGSDTGPIKRGIGMAIGNILSGLGRSGATIRLDANGRYTVFVAVTDIGSGAKTTMALVAAEALDVPLSQIDLVHGDTDSCPFSVGESGSRNTAQTGRAIIDAADSLKKQIAEKGQPTGAAFLVATATPSPQLQGVTRSTFCAHFVDVEVDTEVGRVRLLRYLACQDNGRIINPLTSVSQVKGAVTMGLGMALHERLLYDSRSGVPLNTGYYGARVATHLDAPNVEVSFVETDDGYGAYGSKCMGESGIIPSVAAIANAIFNATGTRFTELPISRRALMEARA
ncbi:MAG: xanthine dehydrogenase family protein molybdopterin-binding subunit [Vicinamibacterales bacterium]